MKEKKVPMRRCAGCMESKEKQYLVRISAYEGNIEIDLTGRAKGRGVYLCRDNSKCWEKAYKKKALERSLSVSIDPAQKEKIFDELHRLGESHEG